jgi:Transposase DDE domain
MRGEDKGTGELFSYVDLEKRVRSDHPLRAIRGLVNEALVALVDEFSALYAPIGRADPDARLYRKGPGKEAKLCFIGHGLMENRHGLLVDTCLTPADGHAERVAALAMIEPRADRPRAITLGADKAYDAEDFVNELRSMTVTPHVAQNTSGRSSAIDARTTRHGGYAVSQRVRKRIEEAFGWIKTVARQEKTKFRGRGRVGWAFTFAAAAYNLVRLPKLIAEKG